MTNVRLLQLVPLDLSVDAARLAQDALAAAGPLAQRIVLSRPMSQTLELSRSRFRNLTVVHALGGAAFGALPSPIPVIFTPADHSVSAWQHRMLISVSRRVPLFGAAPGEAARRRLQRCGVRWTNLWGMLPDGGLPPRRVERNDSLRAELGIAPGDTLVLAPGEASRGSGHDIALWATSILSFAKAGIGRWRLLVTGRGPGLQRLIRFASENDPATLVLAEDAWPGATSVELLSTCDLAVDFGDARSPMRLPLEAQTMGVPLLVSHSSPAAEIALPGQVVADLSPRSVARRILDWQTAAGLPEAAQPALGAISEYSTAGWAHVLNQCATCGLMPRGRPPLSAAN